MQRCLLPAGVFVAGACLWAASAYPAGTGAASAATPTFSTQFLASEQAVATGEALWQQQCRHCHGRAAYPGKAPKLEPRKYTPEFVYDRVTNGFRKMPPWKNVFSVEERRAIVAYVLSDDFSP